MTRQYTMPPETELTNPIDRNSELVQRFSAAAMFYMVGARSESETAPEERPVVELGKKNTRSYRAFYSESSYRRYRAGRIVKRTFGFVLAMTLIFKSPDMPFTEIIYALDRWWS